MKKNSHGADKSAESTTLAPDLAAAKKKPEAHFDARIVSGLLAIDETFSRGMARMETAAASSVASLRGSHSRQLVALIAALVGAMALGIAIVCGAIAG